MKNGLRRVMDAEDAGRKVTAGLQPETDPASLDGLGCADLK